MCFVASVHTHRSCSCCPAALASLADLALLPQGLQTQRRAASDPQQQPRSLPRCPNPTQACNLLDEHLAVLAHRHLGTRFVRALLPRSDGRLLQALGLAGPGAAGRQALCRRWVRRTWAHANGSSAPQAALPSSQLASTTGLLTRSEHRFTPQPPQVWPASGRGPWWGRPAWGHSWGRRRAAAASCKRKRPPLGCGGAGCCGNKRRRRGGRRQKRRTLRTRCASVAGLLSWLGPMALLLQGGAVAALAGFVLTGAEYFQLQLGLCAAPAALAGRYTARRLTLQWAPTLVLERLPAGGRGGGRRRAAALRSVWAPVPPSAHTERVCQQGGGEQRRGRMSSRTGGCSVGAGALTAGRASPRAEMLPFPLSTIL